MMMMMMMMIKDSEFLVDVRSLYQMMHNQHRFSD